MSDKNSVVFVLHFPRSFFGIRGHLIHFPTQKSTYTNEVQCWSLTCVSYKSSKDNGVKPVKLKEVTPKVGLSNWMYLFSLHRFLLVQGSCIEMDGLASCVGLYLAMYDLWPCTAVKVWRFRLFLGLPLNPSGDLVMSPPKTSGPDPQKTSIEGMRFPNNGTSTISLPSALPVCASPSPSSQGRVIILVSAHLISLSYTILHCVSGVGDLAHAPPTIVGLSCLAFLHCAQHGEKV